MEENIFENEIEQSVEDKIFGKQAEIDQMNRMIAENERLIAEGDDVEGRTFLMTHLKKEVANRTKEIEALQSEVSND